MYKVKIEDIEFEPNKILEYKFNEYMKEFNSNVSAILSLKSLGEFIEVTGKIEANLMLVCDRCLNEFEYKLDTNIKETFAKHALYDEYSQELELSSEQFVTDLNGADSIDIYDLLYQSVILALPNKKVCGINCNEGMYVSDEEIIPHDDRMDIFKTIKIKDNK